MPSRPGGPAIIMRDLPPDHPRRLLIVCPGCGVDYYNANELKGHYIENRGDPRELNGRNPRGREAAPQAGADQTAEVTQPQDIPNQ